MKVRKTIGIVVALCLLISAICIVPASAAANLNNFTKIKQYHGQFADVSATAWYEDNVIVAYELGLMVGSEDQYFNASGNITIAETLALACRIHSIYYEDGSSFLQGSPWYQVYIDYALKNGILSSGFDDYTRTATRAEFAMILASALPSDALNKINTVEDGAIPDVSSNASYAKAVYILYRAGILTGNDAYGTFTPNSNIQRNAVAAIVTRMADTSLRKSITLKTTNNATEELNAEKIYQKCSPAVFYIETYDAQGSVLGSGSGFFIHSNGTAVTNYHVIQGAQSAKIILSDTKKEYSVSGVYDYNKMNDWAILKINGSGFSYLNMGEASTVVGGAAVYAIGSPLGLQNTITSGIISNTNRQIDETNYIQTNAAISPGSSGGALINKYGEVVGITSGGFNDGQNLNLALPITYIKNASTGSVVGLSEIAAYSVKLSSTAYSVKLAPGYTETLYITVDTDYEDDYSIVYDIENESCVSGKWGDWNGNTIPIAITGLKAGSTNIFITTDIPSRTKQSITISVDITSTQSVQALGYDEFPNVPDFGAYLGLNCYHREGDHSNFVYFYSIYDASELSDDQFSAYLNLLNQYGFYYSKILTNSDGFGVLLFTNDHSGYELMIGPRYLGGIPYEAIMIVKH